MRINGAPLNDYHAFPEKGLLGIRRMTDVVTEGSWLEIGGMLPPRASAHSSGLKTLRPRARQYASAV